MQPFYPNEQIRAENGFLYREWPGQLKLEFYLDNEVGSYEQEVLEDGELKKYSVDRAPVKLSVRRPKGSEEGASLVVIDGQHRLAALRHVYKLNPAALDEVCVPVCILFPPNSTLAYKEFRGGGEVLSVHSVFRALFVDVNTTMQHVGGHFSILLSDSSLAGIICRKFCDRVLKDYQDRGLAQVEWNIKSKKGSTVLNRAYSITSIGILDKALTKAFSGASKVSCLNFLLAIPEVQNEMFAEDQDAEEPEKYEWDRFSLHQKRFLEQQVNKHVVPCLIEIFFNIEGYKSLRMKFEIAMKGLEAERDDCPNPEFHTAALQHILEYKPIDDDKYYRRAKDIHAALEKSIDSSIEGHVERLLQYAIVQRGIIDAWAVLLDKLKDLPVNALSITKSFVKLVDLALKGDGEIFLPSKPYMQYTVWEAVNIKPTEETRSAISNCLLTLLATESVASQFVEPLALEKPSRIVERLKKLGEARAQEFMSQYHKLRQKYFLKTYKVEFALLSDDERLHLSALEDEYHKQLQEVRDNSRGQEQVSDEFVQAVEKYVARDVRKAISEFRKSFSYTGGIAVEELVTDYETE